ncbi:MAG: glycosyltransferase 61 family protein [Acetobacteraceae bacterium]
MELVKQTAEQAAAQIYTVERTVRPELSANVAFERRFTHPERNPHLGWNPDPRTIRSFQFVNVVLDGEFRGLFDADGFIYGTGYLVPDEVVAAIGVQESLLVGAYSDATVIVGCNVAHRNYFHWVTQALPAIDHAANRISQARNVSIALPPLNSWQEDSLRLLGLAGIKRMTIEDPSKQYALAKVEFSELINGGASFSNSATALATYRRLREAVERPLSRDKKIYVARTDAGSRQMRNEAAVIEEVLKRGYEVVSAGTLSFEEQIRLFRSARIVSGPHGAGLTNIVFCEPGTTVYELLPAHYPNACFANLGMICDLRYWQDAFESEGEGPPNLRHWDSDTKLVADRLDEIDRVDEEVHREAEKKTISAMDFLRGTPGQIQGHRLPPVEQSPSKEGMFRRLLRAIFG